MSQVLEIPSLVYEVVPDRFVGPGEGSPLARLVDRLPHLEGLGVDALTLTPIFPASDPLRLHSTDYHAVDPALGTEHDFTELCEAARARGIGVYVMGAFDHTSAEHPWFMTARSHDEDETSYPPELRTRPYFTFDGAEEHGYACRDSNPDAPELDLRNADVRRLLFTGEQSVLHHWLHAGAAGWRILRADAVGYSILREFRRGTLTVAGGHILIGDIKGFADRYLKDGILDGVVNHYQRQAVMAYLKGQIPARQLSRVLRDVAARYGKAQARGWNLLSGYDLPRARHVLADRARSRLATLLGFTLPGAAHIFYGDEVGLAGKGPPDHLPAMTWNPSRWDDEVHRLHTLLGALRRKLRALREGDFVDLTPEGEDEIVAFARTTRDPRETVLVVLNRASQTRVRKLFAPVCDLPDGLKLRDALEGGVATVRSGTITLEVQGQGARILVPDESDPSGARFFRGY